MKQAKRIVAMVLCLLALLALPAGAVMEKGEPNITAQTTMKEVRNNPGIKNSGFYTYSQDKDCPPGQALWEMTTVEGYTNEYVAEGCAKGLNLVIENYNNGVQVTHSFYTDAEKAADRTKNNTGLFYFPAKAENAKFALILAGSGANESAELEEGLQPVDKTVIDRAVRNVYRDYLADPDPAKMPILGDLYDELLKQPEPEAARIAAALELYVSGSLNVFNHRTNVELSNRLVCFDIKQLGKQLKKLGMLIVQDQIWNRVTINRAEKKSTRYYMDEFHLLLKEEQTAAYSVEIWKRFRKWGGIPTAITQNIKDLLASREVENIFGATR